MKNFQHYGLLVSMFVLCVACGDDDVSDAMVDAVVDDAMTDAMPADAMPDDGYSGVYDVDTVTCGGEVQTVMVTAKVIFDGSSYLEEWTLPNSECEVTLTGTVESTDAQLTIRDVEVTCAEACEPLGFCDPTHCTSDQTYQITKTGDELLMSFTQQGDQFSCGPCGDGIAGSYLLKELP